ncbi:gliding motility-associated C-terminal domain-containing protein [Maribacter dokdonensis]|uniref:Gliding motility-associated C-terminal domain-containing protein n=1 Tax=Maribacter dokdonensis TaxID=320912 RepID=A0A1H4UNN7_9FLAO|nr:gliding motility-associated C-terminal domain-containing protein [Maribacter dokdonensis]SEC70210.1 gliding motility-associated C-terminal domain-containing protein [Maribacter dokdonensis]
MKFSTLKLVLVILFLTNIYTVHSQTNRVLNNNRLRIGSGAENSINNAGNMQQPFYYNGSTYRQLTYSNYPLDIRWGVGGEGSASWNINGNFNENPVLNNQVYDYSGFTVTNNTTGEGYGQIKTTGEITVNGQLFRVENIFELLQPEGYIAIKVKITNISASPATNVRLWVGTRDDYVGGSDGPTKERGNLVDEEFVQIANQADQAKAIKISTAQEAILFFSNSDRAYSTINNCCSFTNATNQNPSTNAITQTGDGSYALYVRFNDLAVNESDELIWYYGAGTLPEIDEIISRVASAAIGAFDNITYNSADYAATTVSDGTGYYVLVPSGSTPPTEAQIEAGVDYNGVSVVLADNAAMLANQEHVFNLTGLSALTTYDFYFVSKYFDGVSDVYTEIIDEELNTNEAPPTLTQINPSTAAYGETITLTGTNFLTTNDVLIGGLNATYTVIDAQTIEAVVPNNVQNFTITVTNESGTASNSSDGEGNDDAACSSDWTSAWQQLTTPVAGTLKTVTLKLENTHSTNSYDLFLEVFDVDNAPGSADPSIKFSNSIETSQAATIANNTTSSEITFAFDSSVNLLENTDYYIVLVGSGTNPGMTGNQEISIDCAGGTNGGSAGSFGTLYHSFTMGPEFDISNPPTAINSTPSSIKENNEINDIIGSLTATDADVSDSHTFQLIAGAGDTDNASFSISGSDLLASEIFDFETKSSYSIRILTTDEDGNTYEGNLILTITDEVDEDSDGVNDSVDNCPAIANADQLDTDSDGAGNVCDTDDDNDGTLDTEDDFPLDDSEDTDTDGDGTGDNADTDDDNDGTLDTEDDFPLDDSEDTDTDGDGTGDNTDTDDDNDGTLDTEDDFPLDNSEDTDTDGDGTGDNADTDDDNDGTLDTEDDFPLDDSEDTDTDGDGTGDNADTDDDNDGTLDDEDAFPLDDSEDMDTDGDGTGDNADTDDDNDGTLDDEDAFPLDDSENTDTDGDGTGDNADTDDDNDGTLDAEDDFPLDDSEDTDTDGDGTGDNADTDDDNDGTLDTEDAFPLDDSEDTDTDGDGTGDNADTDDDNDGTLDTEDDFPLDDSEDTDTDGDGTGDNADELPNDPNEIKDTDGDGVGDNSDVFPNDANESIDTDGDGVGDNADVFPNDPSETIDTDSDGIGDNTDTDDDNDGYSDEIEAEEGTDTRNLNDFPNDNDNDGIPDSMDLDDDNDGVNDVDDSFPTIEEPLLVPAQAFTPNGDGINDTWMVPGINNYPNNLVKVFNRWGHEVFVSSSYQNDWNGKHKSNSSLLPAGSYLYVIDLGNGTPLLKGWIFINY